MFVEVCVLRRQPGYQPTRIPPPAPAGSSTQGGVSPARTPVTGSGKRPGSGALGRAVARPGAGDAGGGGEGDGGAARDTARQRSDFLGKAFLVVF